VRGRSVVIPVNRMTGFRPRQETLGNGAASPWNRSKRTRKWRPGLFEVAGKQNGQANFVSAGHI
jgi:hypothetical protein